jgi:hypothetical protein
LLVNLFGRAKKALGGGRSAAEDDAPQYYRVACPEGHVLSGQRSEGYQALRCPACGEGVFILPRSPLPDPPAPVAQRTKRRRAAQPVAEGPIELTDAPAQVEVADSEADVEIEWEDEAPPPAPAAEEPPHEEAPAPAARPRPRPGGAAARERGADVPRRPQAPASRPAAPERPRIELAPRRTFRQRLYRRRHALLLLGVIALVVGTVGFRLLRTGFANLPRVAETNRAEGIAALEEGSFDVARQKLDRAAWALEQLGDPEAADVRQAANEAGIFAGLASRSLEQIVEEVATHPDGASQFDTLHKGRSILIETQLEPGGELAYRIFSSGKIGRIDTTGFRLLDGRRPGESITFGARLAGIKLGDDNQWRVTLEPDSGVFISTPSAWTALERLGWPSRAEPADATATKKAEDQP